MIAAVNLAIREKEKKAFLRGDEEDAESDDLGPFSRARQRVLDAQNPDVKDKWMSSRIVRHVYGMPVSQIAVAIVIAMNFVISALEVQFLPEEGSVMFIVFEDFGHFFMAVFCIELLWNWYGCGPWKFFLSAWNVFDFIIVAGGIVQMIFPDMPGFTVLRLFRAFRVFRLFKRIPSLQAIIVGIARAMPSVLQTTVILLMVMSIWAIMGTEFYIEYLPEFYGSYFKALFTLTQIYSGEWAYKARYLLYEEAIASTPFFYVSYYFVSVTICGNVVIATLVDQYISDEEENAGVTGHKDPLVGDVVDSILAGYRTKKFKDAWAHMKSELHDLYNPPSEPLALMSRRANSQKAASAKAAEVVPQISIESAANEKCADQMPMSAKKYSVRSGHEAGGRDSQSPELSTNANDYGDYAESSGSSVMTIGSCLNDSNPASFHGKQSFHSKDDEEDIGPGELQSAFTFMCHRMDESMAFMNENHAILLEALGHLERRLDLVEAEVWEMAAEAGINVNMFRADGSLKLEEGTMPGSTCVN
mmetsp:Transcript_79342/g.140014  ORF Transcript_79342/g.140014 Transcript_79342/m.140014 type:complete len:531 (-) Transcript_79342:391-1983(-)